MPGNHGFRQLILGKWYMGKCWDKSLAGFARTVAFAAMVAGIAMPALAAKPSGIGVTSLVVKQVEGKTEQQIRQLALRDDVFQDEVVETGIESASELRFSDDTRISVGPNSSVVLDKFVYDPEPGKGTFALNVTEGVFRFFSGKMDHSNYRIQTSNVTVGVRGTVLVMVTRADGAVAVIMESDDGVEVTSNSGNSVLLDTPGKATVAFADGTITPQGDPPAWALWRIREMDNLLATAGLPPPPAPSQEAPSPAGNDVQTASAPPPPPPPEEVPPPPPPAPPPPPPTTDEPPQRGIPRASYNRDGTVPPGGDDAASVALEPDPPKGGHDGGLGASGSGAGQEGTAGDGTGNGHGDGNGHAGGNGKGNGPK